MTNAPLKIFFEITRSCNLKCKGCYIPNMSGDSMDFEKVCNVLDDAAASQVLSVQFL
jgi:MoaA/NifB/PqqE/SkfB family radical SAM enzyme